MQQIFVNCVGKDFEAQKSYSRSRAKGYQNLVFDEAVEMFSAIEVVTEGNNLKVNAVEHNPNEEDHYVILCKEFGLVGYKEKFWAGINVLYLDNGYMLITLYDGGLIIKMEGEDGKVELQMPLVGTETHPAVHEEDIEWFDEERMLSYTLASSDPLVKRFPYDYEFDYSMRGGKVGGMCSMEFKVNSDNYSDISLGAIAAYEQSEAFKAEAKRAKEMMSKVTSATSKSTNQDDDWDDDDEDESDDDWDDDDDDF